MIYWIQEKLLAFPYLLLFMLTSFAGRMWPMLFRGTVPENQIRDLTKISRISDTFNMKIRFILQKKAKYECYIHDKQ